MTWSPPSPEVFTKLAADADAPDASAANVGTAHTDNTSAAVMITAKMRSVTRTDFFINLSFPSHEIIAR